jgi:hypothetical protein
LLLSSTGLMMEAARAQQPRKHYHSPDDCGSKELWNVGKFIRDYKAQQSRRQPNNPVFCMLCVQDLEETATVDKITAVSHHCADVTLSWHGCGSEVTGWLAALLEFDCCQ